MRKKGTPKAKEHRRLRRMAKRQKKFKDRTRLASHILALWSNEELRAAARRILK